MAGQALVEAVELGAAGQPAVDQQPGDLNEGRALGELLDGDAAIAEDALLAVDVGDGALAGAGIAEAGSRVIRPVSARSRVRSKASSPSEPSTTGNSTVWPPNVRVAVRVIASVPSSYGLASQ